MLKVQECFYIMKRVKKKRMIKYSDTFFNSSIECSFLAMQWFL